MSLCEAFLEKPRTDTTEDFRCALLSGAGPRGNLLSGVSMLRVAGTFYCRQHAGALWPERHGSVSQVEGSDVGLVGCGLMLSLQPSTNTTLTLGVCRILYQHSQNSSMLQIKKMSAL